MEFAEKYEILSKPPAQCLFIDHGQKILVAERGNLVFVFNFSVGNSVFGYPIHVHGLETRELVLDTDLSEIGGHGRVDHTFDFPVTADGVMQIYTPSRSGLVFAKKS